MPTDDHGYETTRHIPIILVVNRRVTVQIYTALVKRLICRYILAFAAKQFLLLCAGRALTIDHMLCLHVISGFSF